jgi:hypothetical protein
MTEVEYLKGQLEDTKKAIRREQNKADMKELAEYIHDMYKAFMDAGFSEDQAWQLAGASYQSALGNN